MNEAKTQRAGEAAEEGEAVETKLASDAESDERHDYDTGGEEDEDEEAHVRGARKRKRDDAGGAGGGEGEGDEDEDGDEPEDEDDDDDEDDEDDEDDRGKRKRQGSRFLELEAEVDDEEDYEEEEDEEARRDIINDDESGDDEFADEEREALALREQRRRAQEQFARQQQSAEELERFVQERYGQHDEQEYGDEEEEERAAAQLGATPTALAGERGAAEIEQQSLLPTVHDPKLHMVKCKSGKEKEACICLMQKAVELQSRGAPLNITAVVAPDHLRGRVYVEARRESDVRAAIKGIRILFQSTVSLVPLKEMVDVMAVRQRAAQVARGQWVRVKRGVYAGDLAQLYEVRERELVVKLVPRLDLRALSRKRVYGGSRAAAAAGAQDDEDSRMKQRPARKLFDRGEVERVLRVNVFARRDRLTGELFDELENDQFKHGLLYKTVNRRAVRAENIEPPTVEELEPFKEAEQAAKRAARRRARAEAGGDDGGDALYESDEEAGEENDDARGGAGARGEADAALRPEQENGAAAAGAVIGEASALASAVEAAAQSSDRAEFVRGDSVRVARGDLRNLEGVVDVVLPGGKALVKPRDGLRQPVQILTADLEKDFREGAHVKVMGGRHAGVSGLIVALTPAERGASVLTDVTGQVVRVPTAQLAESSEQSAGAAVIAGGLYHVFDLVLLHSDPRGAGVIIRGQRDKVTLITEQGKVKTVDVADVKTRRDTRNARTLDSRNNSVGVGDGVKVVNERHAFKNREGSVLHVFSNRVFIKARDVLENAGVVVAGGNEILASHASNRQVGPAAPLGAASMPFSRMGATHGGLGGLGGALSGIGRGGGGGGGGRPPRRDDAMFRKEVVVTRGPHKGLAGKVIEATDAAVRVELESSMRIVTVSKDKIRLKNELMSVGRTGAIGGFYGPGSVMGSAASTYMGSTASSLGGNTPSYMRQTPGRGFGAAGAATPTGAGARTPMHPSATPLHPSMQTPSHDFGGGGDVWRPMTPAPSHATPQHPQAPPPPPSSSMYGSMPPQQPSAYSAFSSAAPPSPAPPPPPPPATSADAAARDGATDGSTARATAVAAATSPPPSSSSPAMQTSTTAEGGAWLGCYVRINTPEHAGMAIVRGIEQQQRQQHGLLRVEMLQDGSASSSPSSPIIVTVSSADVNAVQPATDDAVAVIDGDLIGLRGTLLTIDDDGDCIVKDEANEVHILDKSVLCKRDGTAAATAAVAVERDV